MQFVNLMALMAAWVYVFDTIQKEREMLEQPEQVCFVELLHFELQLVCEPFWQIAACCSASSLISLSKPSLCTVSQDVYGDAEAGQRVPHSQQVGY